MRLLQNTLFLFLSLFALGSCQSSKDAACAPLTRAAYDIGSGTTKMKVARVNPCEGKILKVLAEEQIKVDYKQSLTGNRTFSPEVIQEGLAAIKKLADKAKTRKLDETRAVATASFREAANGDELVALIKSEIGIEVEIITQQKEALLGYLAALNEVSAPAEEVVVWDIGGGSQQMVYSDGKADPKIYTNEMGSVVFKDLVVEKIKAKNPTTQISPNPLNLVQISKAQKLLDKTQYPKDLFSALHRPKIQVLGIGGVHAFSISGQLKKEDQYTLNEVDQTLKTRAGWNDQKIQSEYAATEITNLILVGTMMKKLGINEVKPLKVNLTDALLIQ